MPLPRYASWMLAQEARALLCRLARIKPFALEETMVPAAGLLPQSQSAIENYLIAGRRQLRSLVEGFIQWLNMPEGASSSAAEAQRRFSIIRLRFNAVLTQFDLFQNVMTQRSEHETGVWMSGLDVAAADALRLRGAYYEPPPVICYLDRGVGAAIRRARTRLPGGGFNPVAIIRVPRERMVGSGIASSLVHEVGHQAAALLELVESLRPVLAGIAAGSRADKPAWQLWEKWISEIVADYWSVAQAGIGSTLGLLAVVSLPRVFVFRVNPDDPHPSPWIRVKLSAAIGNALYPDIQWARIAALWESFYPLDGLPDHERMIFRTLEQTIPGVVAVLRNHRLATLRGRTLTDVLFTNERQPGALRNLLARWRTNPAEMYRARPTLAFAVMGQARFDGAVSPEEESTVLGKLLTHWALQSTLQAAAGCVKKSSGTPSCSVIPATAAALGVAPPARSCAGGVATR
jgi:hypothetical protein